MSEEEHTETKKQNGLIKFLKGLGIIVFACVLTATLTLIGFKMYLFPGEFRPVTLNQKEERVLEQKLTKIRAFEAMQPQRKNRYQDEKPLKPLAYNEAGAIKEVSFTEKEINALIAKNTDLATKLAVDISPDLASARLRIPLDPDMPFVGGQTLKASAGLELGYEQGKPIVVLKGVMLWGVPIPNAWLGNLKNVDLVNEFENENGFWRAFSEGIENIALENEKITIEFKD